MTIEQEIAINTALCEFGLAFAELSDVLASKIKANGNSRFAALSKSNFAEEDRIRTEYDKKRKHMLVRLQNEAKHRILTHNNSNNEE